MLVGKVKTTGLTSGLARQKIAIKLNLKIWHCISPFSVTITKYLRMGTL
jgi:hypothetical protein